MRIISIAMWLAVSLTMHAANGNAEDQISFGIDWRAEAEYGGYYQAVANGIYAKHGLAVTIREGGPQVNQMQLMMAGRLDFNLGGGRAMLFNRMPIAMISQLVMKFVMTVRVILQHDAAGGGIDGDLLDAGDLAELLAHLSQHLDIAFGRGDFHPNPPRNLMRDMQFVV